jgi:hypothetical protein
MGEDPSRMGFRNDLSGSALQDPHFAGSKTIVLAELHRPSRLPAIHAWIVVFAIAVVSLSTAHRAGGICACCCSGSGANLAFCGTTNLTPIAPVSVRAKAVARSRSPAAQTPSKRAVARAIRLTAKVG